jgi:hypothetical protein
MGRHKSATDCAAAFSDPRLVGRRVEELELFEGASVEAIDHRMTIAAPSDQ